MAALGEREQAPGNSAAVLLRQQAFTLFVNTYDQVRRAIGYLRWSTNDAETIAPSLWAGRGKRPTVEADASSASDPTAPATGSLHHHHP